VTWDPDRYHRFREERFAPFEDLFAMIGVRPGMEVVDLGCGTGELTLRLADRLPESRVVGLDNSEEMLARARPLTRPGLDFRLERIEDASGTYDLVFSHAAVHWVEDHPALMARLWGMVRGDGQLAVQMPANHGSIAHRTLTEVAQRTPFAEALGGWTRTPPVLRVEEYAEILHGLGAVHQNVLEKVYPHVLDDADAVAEWMRGTALVPYLERLPEALHGAFLAAFREFLRERMPARPVFYGFRRILFTAEKGIS